MLIHSKILILALLGGHSEQAANAPIDIANFNGTTWNAISIGVTTDAEVKKLFKTDRKAIRPEALRLRQSPGGPLVDALLDGRGAKAKVTAFRIEYPVPTRLDSLTKEIGEKPKLYYQRFRQERWHLAVFPTKGIVAVIQGLTDSPIIYLVGPSKIGQLVDDYSDKEEPVIVVKDPFAGQPRIAMFGSVRVSYNLKNIGIEDQEDDRKFLEKSLRNITARGVARFVAGESGEATAIVSTEYSRNKGGTITVSASFRSQTQYGSVYAFQTRSESLPESSTTVGAANLKLRAGIAYAKALIGLQSALEETIYSNVMKQGPPPINLIRLNAWQKLLEDAGSKARND